MFDSCGRPSRFCDVSTPWCCVATNSRAVASSMAGRTPAARRHSVAAPARRRPRPACGRPARHRRRPRRPASAPPQRGGQEAAGEGVAGAGRVDHGRRPARRRRARRAPSAWRSSTGRAPSLTTSSAGADRRRRARASATLANTTSGASSPSRAANRSTPNASTTATDDTSTLSRPPARRARRDELRGGCVADRLGAQRVGRHVQPRHAGQPRRVDRRQLLGRAAVGQHRALAVRLDEHDDRARCARPAGRGRRRRPGRPATPTSALAGRRRHRPAR